MRADARRNYERLIAVAGQIFHRDGTEASLEEIAKTAGVGIGTLYRHFPTRRALVLAVIDQSRAELEDRARELQRSAAPEEALLGWVRGLIDHTARYRGLSREYLIGLRGDNEEFRQSCEDLQVLGRELLGQAQSAGSIRSDLTVPDLLKLVGAVAWIAECDTRESADRMLELALGGLRTR
ncbi:MAG: TetR/AcrR family transcriptional regulator [Nonomuraea sp.]|nr:TetR/AcrR family transcriptional regulator [Nonomuraea sp.]